MPAVPSSGAEGFSTRNLDYLQRTGESFVLSDALDEIQASPPPVRQICNIRSIGRLAKDPPAGARQTAEEWQLSHLVSEAFLIGLHQQDLALAYCLRGDGAATHLSLGLWSSREGGVPESAGRTLQAMLDGAYPGIDLEDAATSAAVPFPASSACGVVRGVPTPKPPDASDGAYAVDRLIRAMSGDEWEALVLAEPLAEAAVRRLRGLLLAEMRAIYGKAETSSPTPLAGHYNDLLQANLETFATAQAVGGWRVGVYLLGTDTSFPRLGGLWRGIFAGEESKPEPIRVTRLDRFRPLAATWVLPDNPEDSGPGGYSHPFRYQTVLSSSQLAGYVHLPQLETAGFSVQIAPQFDTVPPEITGDAPGDQPFRIGGEIVSRLQRARTPRVTDTSDDSHRLPPYAIPRRFLTQHALVCGVTGSGKTTTIFDLLVEATRAGMSFLVLEPAKAEYRALTHPELVGESLQVFTIGAEWASPLRLNPLEILPGVPVGLHLDLLRSVFGASFGMWVPLPQVLERCLNEVYEDRGWDLDGRRPLEGSEHPAFPTLDNLVEKVREIVPGLGFDPEARDRILGSLAARLEGLRSGAKGRMYDVGRSVGMDTLLTRPTVLELESLGDDDDKAFFMGLLLIRLAEHRRVRHESGNGNEQHLLVIEEAHRLLTNVPRSVDDKQADPRGKAVETFTNLLSEIRAYQQGVIIADQIPTRLAPDVIKNTGLKIAHRTVSGDDREELGRAMIMNPRQVAALGSLRDGYAAVFCGARDDAPLLVKFPKKPKADPPRDGVVRELMADIEEWRYYPTPACETYCAVHLDENGARARATDTECTMAKRALADDACRQALSRLVLAVTDSAATVEQMGENLYSAVRRVTPDGCQPDRLYGCYAVQAGGWLADRWGSQRRWSQPQIERLATTLRRMLRSLPPSSVGDLRENTAALQEDARNLQPRSSPPPYALCDQICKQRAGLCLYRHPGAEALASGEFRADVERVRTRGYADIGEAADRIEYLTRAVGWRLAPLPHRWDFPKGLDPADAQQVQDASQRVQLCLAQQMITDDPRVLPVQARVLFEHVEARAPSAENPKPRAPTT